MIGQTIPSTVPGTRPASPPSTFTELAQTGGPDWIFPAVMFAVALLLAGAALMWLVELWRVRR